MLLVLQFKVLQVHFEAVSAKKKVLMWSSGTFQLSMISLTDRTFVVAGYKRMKIVSHTDIQGSLTLKPCRMSLSRLYLLLPLQLLYPIIV